MIKKIIFILTLAALPVCSAWAYDYKYYLGPMEADGDGWDIPEGTVGSVDLRKISEADSPGVVFLAVSPDVTLGPEYTLLVRGDIKLADATEAIKNAWEAKTGYRPEGEKLIDLLWNQLTEGADPEGLTGPKPIMPTSKGRLNLHLGGHSLIKSEPFVYGAHPHTSKVRDVLRSNYRKQFNQYDKAKGKSRKHQLRVLDMLAEKHRLENPEEEFVPDDLPKEKPLKHETTISDDWDSPCSSGTNIDCDIDWSELSGDFEIKATARIGTVANGVLTTSIARAETDLSSDDHYVQATVARYSVSNTSANQMDTALIVRKDSSSTLTYYRAFESDGSGGNFRRLQYVNAGSASTIGSATAATSSTTTQVARLEIDGSDLTYTLDGTTIFTSTHTSITGNLRTGLYNQKGTADQIATFDNYEAGDIAAPPASSFKPRAVIV